MRRISLRFDKPTDEAHTKGTGPLGARSLGARGFQVMNLIVVDRKGVPLGLCGQAWWARTETAVTKSNKSRSTEEKETKHWGIARPGDEAVVSTESR